MNQCGSVVGNIIPHTHKQQKILVIISVVKKYQINDGFQFSVGTPKIFMTSRAYSTVFFSNRISFLIFSKDFHNVSLASLRYTDFHLG